MALAPAIDFGWLYQLECDLKLVAQPMAKLDRLVTSNRLVEAGLALIIEAKQFASDPARAPSASATA